MSTNVRMWKLCNLRMSQCSVSFWSLVCSCSYRSRNYLFLTFARNSRTLVSHLEKSREGTACDLKYPIEDISGSTQEQDRRRKKATEKKTAFLTGFGSLLFNYISASHFCKLIRTLFRFKYWYRYLHVLKDSIKINYSWEYIKAKYSLKFLNLNKY